MKRKIEIGFKMKLSLIIVVWIAFFASFARADEIFASAPPGPAGLTITDPLVIGSVPLSNDQLLGVRFDIQTTTLVSGAGGYLMSLNDEALFAAIVPLANSSAFPSGAPFDASTVASSLFTPGATSGDYFASFDVVLDPGWYALVMGAGYFGSPSSAGALLVEDGSGSPPSMFGWDTLAGPPPTTWSSYAGDTDFRMVVESTPEPLLLPGVVLIVGGIVLFDVRRRILGS